MWEPCDLLSGVRARDWHTENQTGTTLWRSAPRFTAGFVRICLFALPLFVCRMCVLCVSVHMCKPVRLTQPRCPQVCVCVLCLCSKAAPTLFLLTCVVLLGDFSPCCHISIPHWNTLILSLVQQPCGDWANIDLHCHWTPAGLGERQDVVLCWGQSQHEIKVEQTEV